MKKEIGNIIVKEIKDNFSMVSIFIIGSTFFGFENKYSDVDIICYIDKRMLPLLRSYLEDIGFVRKILPMNYMIGTFETFELGNLVNISIFMKKSEYDEQVTDNINVMKFLEKETALYRFLRSMKSMSHKHKETDENVFTYSGTTLFRILCNLSRKESIMSEKTNVR